MVYPTGFFSAILMDAANRCGLSDSSFQIITAWNDLPGMELIATAPRTGNPLIVEWFVGYYSRLDTIVISNQGPGLQELLACLTDAEALITPSDSTFFPGVPSGVEVHDGFKMSRRFSASAKLEAISALVEQHSSASVTLTGLGRGGAITLLDALYPSLHLLSTHIIGVTHGMLRVGNQAFPNYIDSVLLDVGRVTNHQDPIPILPRIFLGFHHTSVPQAKNISAPKLVNELTVPGGTMKVTNVVLGLFQTCSRVIRETAEDNTTAWLLKIRPVIHH